MCQVQDEITRWAQERFPHRTDFHAIYKLVVEEVPELMVHKKEKGVATIGTELADCFILLLDLASMWEVDIAQAIHEKMQTNYSREWNKDENGIMQHVKIDLDPEKITGVKCPHCGNEDKIESAAATSIFLYHCTACGENFDDDIPF